MDELIDIVNSEGGITGQTCLKSFAHQNGLLHASVHVWFYTKNQKILIQKRKETKDIFPNLWDVSVAGHVAVNEKPIDAAIREIKEEIGVSIQPEKLKYINFFEEKHHHSNEIIDHEIHYIYITQLNSNFSDLVPQKEEVSALKLIHIHELENSFKDSTKYVPHTNEYYNYIIKTLKEIK